MRRQGIGLVAVALGACALGLSGGCFVATDALNPDLFAALGFDAATIFPGKGTIIVSFTNSTDSAAVFHAWESQNATDLTISSRNFSVEVDPNSRGNEVLSCPVAVLSLGSLDASFAPQPLAVDVLATAGAVQVTYTGGELFSGSELKCGDVVDVQLTAAGAGFGLTVRVIPGAVAVGP